MTTKSDSSPFGKLTESVTLFMSESTKNGLTYLAMSRRMNLSEYIRAILDEKVHGAVELTRASSAKRDPVTITGSQEVETEDRRSVRELADKLGELSREVFKLLNTPLR